MARMIQAEDVREIASTTARIRAAVATVIEGKPEAIRMVLIALLAEGHLLLEDVPGVGKTMLAKALGRALDVDVNRIQFTPDLMPSDITGVSIYAQDTRSFEFKPGALFANVVLGDEINRASPKTQSALLEAMEEMQVSIDGTTHPLPRPFMVIATQNPLEMEGTYPLPEAQRDRFLARIAIGYPSTAAELRLLDSHGTRDALAEVEPVTDGAQVAAMIEVTRQVHVSEELKNYLVGIVAATRDSEELRLGASPRASLHLLRAARASAVLDGRDYVNPDDIRTLAAPVLAHRVILSPQARLAEQTTAGVVADIARRMRVPGER